MTNLNNEPTQVHSIKRYLLAYKVPLLIATLFAVVGSAMSIYGPNKLSEVTDLITAGLTGPMNLQRIGSICLTLAILYVLGTIFSYLQSFIIVSYTQKFSQYLREQISLKIGKIPLNYFDSHTQGETLSRVTNDLDTVSQSLNQSVSTLISSIAMFFGCLFMMIKMNLLLSVTAVVAVFCGFSLTIVIMMKSQKHFAGQQASLAEINGFVEETYSGHNALSVYNASDEMLDQFDVLNNRLFDNVWRAQFLSGIMQPLMGFIGNFGYVAVCVVGAILALKGSITMGVIVAFMVYVRMFSTPLSQIAQAFTNLQSAEAAIKRVFEFLNEAEMEDDTEKVVRLDQSKGNVTFDKVTFGYHEGETIIHDFTATAKSGQKIAIVGPTGAGKTTIVNLLMKFYQVNQGSITIDGVPINQMSREEVHNQFCMVLQDTWIFEGTIKENLIFNQPNVSDETVIAACQAVGVHHFITTLPDGYETVLDDNVEISVGQKQLLTIARALIKDAPMLILDEATSSVDTRTEELIQQAMDKLMEGKTSFVIAHRLSTIRNADLILVMKEGNIIEQGSHEELIQAQGFYADLYRSQFE